MAWQDRHSIIPAVYVLVERDGKVLFIRRFQTGFADGKYSLPAGHLDGNESPMDTAVREAAEEVGLLIRKDDLECVHTMFFRASEGDHERVSIFFRASTFGGEPRNLEPHKADDIRWLTPDAYPEEIVWEASHALREITAGNQYSEIY